MFVWMSLLPTDYYTYYEEIYFCIRLKQIFHFDHFFLLAMFKNIFFEWRIRVVFSHILVIRLKTLK